MLLPIADRAGHAALRAAGFRKRTVATDEGAVFAYDWRGEGALPPLVVVHGIGSRAVHLSRVLVALRAHASRIVAVDLPGHGRSALPPSGLHRASMTRGVRQALDALIDEPAVLVGNSLGGLAVIRYAGAQHDRVRGVLLVAPGGAPSRGDDLTRFLGQFNMPRRRDAMAFLDKLHVRKPWYARLIAGDIRRTFQAGPMRAFVDGVTEDDLLAPDELSALHMPGRVLWGTHEKLLPPEQRAFFREHLPPHVEFEEPAFSHCPHFDAPGRLTDEIVRFAKGLP